MRKKTLALLLAVFTLVAVFAGCTAQPADPAATTSAATTTAAATSAATSASAATTAAAGGRSDESRVIKTAEGDFTFYETGYPITEEKSTFSVLVATNVTDIGNSPMMTQISEFTNVYPEWQVVARTAIDERKALLWASDNYPDVLGPRTVNKNDINTYGPLGILIPLNNLLDKYATWLKELAPESVWPEMTCFDGNMYYIPTVYDTERYERQYMMPATWLETLNLDVPTNIEEFYDCLVAIRDGDPNGNGEKDEIPFAIGQVWGSVFDTMPAFYCFFGRPGTYYIDDNKQVIDGRLYEEHKEGIKFLQKCYQEGLLDVELYTQDGAAFRAKGASDPAIYGFMMGYSISYYVGEKNFELYKAMPLLADQNGNKSYIFNNSNLVATSTSMVITSSCECPEIVMRWANYIHTPEISMQIDWAPIGIGYNQDANGKITRITDAPKGFDSMNSWRDTYNEQQFPRLQNTIVKQYLTDNFGMEWVETPAGLEAAKAVEYYLPYAVQEIPQVTPTAEETEELNSYMPDLDKLYEETVAAWVTGNADIDAQWNKFIADMNAFGAQEVIAIKQTQVDRYYGN